jgi:hypothetical protein
VRLTLYKVAQMLSHPNVSMIGIGQDPNNVDGIPVRVIRADYQPATQPEELPRD